MALFTTVKKAKVRKTAFNLSHERKQTMEMGKLTPVLCEEVVPGDKFFIKTDIMVKLAPLIVPLMHRMDIYIHYFFVPNRILWDGWEEFITGNAATSIPTKTLTNTWLLRSTLMDYMGLPVATDLGMTVGDYVFSQLPFRAYYSIWNEYYRDQNTETEVDIANLTNTHYQNMKYRSWAKDYFTSALPWTQKGDAVKIPMDGLVEWESYDTGTGEPNGDFGGVGNNVQSINSGGVNTLHWAAASSSNAIGIKNTGIHVNDLRTAVRIQRWLERNARAGTRYVEHLLAHWGVRSKDASLQRPEFIGGGKTPIVISEVLQTSETSGSNYLGSPAGHGIGVGSTNIANKFCEEHGWILGIASIVPKPAYYQGIHKKFTRSVNTDFYYPEFANLGEQEVLNQELYWQGSGGGTDDTETFGYQSRYAEYKYSHDTVHGEYRNSFEEFHLGRKFASLPALNSTFTNMAAEAPTLEERIFAAGRDADPFWCQIYHNIKAIRPMPYYGTPSLI